MSEKGKTKAVFFTLDWFATASCVVAVVALSEAVIPACF